MKEAEKRLSPHLKKMSNMGIKEMANIKGMVGKMSKNLKNENAQKEPQEDIKAEWNLEIEKSY